MLQSFYDEDYCGPNTVVFQFLSEVRWSKSRYFPKKKKEKEKNDSLFHCLQSAKLQEKMM